MMVARVTLQLVFASAVAGYVALAVEPEGNVCSAWLDKYEAFHKSTRGQADAKYLQYTCGELSSVCGGIGASRNSAGVSARSSGIVASTACNELCMSPALVSPSMHARPLDWLGSTRSSPPCMMPVVARYSSVSLCQVYYGQVGTLMGPPRD